MLRILFFSLSLLFCHSAYANQADQHAFEQAKALVAVGELQQALEQFASLYQRTGSPRVKLEWADVALMLGQFNLAQSLYNDVLDLAPPLAVQARIQQRLLLIPGSRHDFNWQIQMGQEYNPFAQAESQIITLFGLPFLYQPQTQAEKLWGVHLNAQHQYRLNASQPMWLDSYLAASLFEGNNNQKWQLGSSLVWQPNSLSPWRYQLGLSTAQQQQKNVMNTAHVGLQYQTDSSLRQLRIEQQTYPQSDNDKAWLVTASHTGFTNLNQTIPTARYQLGWQHKHAEAAVNSYTGPSLQISQPLPKQWLPLTLQAQLQDKNFQAFDYLYGVKRQDLSWQVSTTLSLPATPAHNLQIELGYQQNDSNIGMFEYQRYFANLHWQSN